MMQGLNRRRVLKSSITDGQLDRRVLGLDDDRSGHSWNDQRGYDGRRAADFVDHFGPHEAHRVQEDVHGGAHLGSFVERAYAVGCGSLGLKDAFAQAEMFARLGMIIDAAFVELAVLAAHFVKKLFVDVVVQVGERDLFVGYRSDPVLVVLERLRRNDLVS